MIVIAPRVGRYVGPGHCRTWPQPAAAGARAASASARDTVTTSAATSRLR